MKKGSMLVSGKYVTIISGIISSRGGNFFRASFYYENSMSILYVTNEESEWTCHFIGVSLHGLAGGDVFLNHRTLEIIRGDEQ